MSTPRDSLAQRIREILSLREVREVKMFGGLSFMVDGRMVVAAGRKGDLLVHIDPDSHEMLLQRGGEMAYMGADRPMGDGWISVPRARIEDEVELAFWVQVGLDYLSAQPKKAV